MNNLEINKSENKDIAKKTYHSPELTPYGNLSELVQINPGRGADGGSFDCTFS